MGNVNPVDTLANVATGGLYEAGKGIAEGRPLQAASTLGPFGSVVQPTMGTGPALMGDLIGAGAGLGGALAGGGSSMGGVADLGPGPMVGVDVNGAPLYLVKTAAGVSEMTAAQAAAAGIPTMTAAGLAGGMAAGSGGGTGALMGAGAGGTAAQLAQAMTSMQPMPGGPSTPSAFPTGGALPGGPSPAQLSAVASEKHPGLAPWFALRARGQQPPGGIAEPGNAAALGVMQQNPNLWMQR